jgi:hypothetical protein
MPRLNVEGDHLDALLASEGLQVPDDPGELLDEVNA